MMWPEYKRAKDLVGTVFPAGISEETIKQLARKHGIGRSIGRNIVFSAEDRVEPRLALFLCLLSLSEELRVRQRRGGA